MQDKGAENLDRIEDAITGSSFWEQFINLLEIKLLQSDDNTITLTVGLLLVVVVILILTSFILAVFKRLLSQRLPKEDKAKFNTVFSFTRWFIYVIVLIIALSGIGVNVTAIIAASAGLLIGVGLALQTLFQDFISGVFILIDQSVHVGDIIELEGKVGRVEEIKLRTTRAVTFDNKVLIIPNHLYLTNSLYNWTQNGTNTREWVDVGVGFNSDIQLVEKLLMQAAESIDLVFKSPPPKVTFIEFGESTLNFRVAFTLEDSFNARIPKSDIRFEINRLFRENNINIAYPQRDIHIIQKPDQNIKFRMNVSESDTNKTE
ncbi:mechanosensitive ion channel [Bizionia gelidisalsuginis]|uniref:Mechanosensitive ion channel n=1 Tax=Bizionia gelidisalsuginis TaxID=291188 RepID=A0ABY3MDN2_9FLAO|nr:mechanosensitive ion channel domain-containing protein [Bizionia gelidisalsuginis]TYC17122.1 mechanosensitive ion channel [Bizionia gelidisalsuginis]